MLLVTDVRRKNPVIWQQTDLHTAADNKFGYGSLRLLKTVLCPECRLLSGRLPATYTAESALLPGHHQQRLVNQLYIIGRHHDISSIKLLVV